MQINTCCRSIKQEKAKDEFGFTLFELIIVITIIGILAALAIPSFASSISKQQLRKGAGDIVAVFNEARAQAALSGKPASLIFDANTNTFSIRYADVSDPTNLITTTQYELEDRLSITATNMPAVLQVQSTGRIVTPTGTNVIFRVCDDGFSGEEGYTVWINSLGITRARPGAVTGISSAVC